MRNAIPLILTIFIVPGGCSFLDFFGYEDNAPLHVIQRPEGYPSVMFGAEIAPTFFRQGESSADLVAVSAGTGYPTLFYRLSINGKLTDVEDPYNEYLSDNEPEAEILGSGSSLVGLPSWENGEFYTGCVAIGEPMAGKVTIVCEQDKEIFQIESGATGVDGAYDDSGPVDSQLIPDPIRLQRHEPVGYGGQFGTSPCFRGPRLLGSLERLEDWGEFYPVHILSRGEPLQLCARCLNGHRVHQPVRPKLADFSLLLA